MKYFEIDKGIYSQIFVLLLQLVVRWGDLGTIVLRGLPSYDDEVHVKRERGVGWGP